MCYNKYSERARERLLGRPKRLGARATHSPLTKGVTTLVCRFGDYLAKNKSCGEEKPSLFILSVPLTAAAARIYHFKALKHFSFEKHFIALKW